MGPESSLCEALEDAMAGMGLVPAAENATRDLARQWAAPYWDPGHSLSHEVRLRPNDDFCRVFVLAAGLLNDVPAIARRWREFVRRTLAEIRRDAMKNGLLETYIGADEVVPKSIRENLNNMRESAGDNELRADWLSNVYQRAWADCGLTPPSKLKEWCDRFLGGEPLRPDFDDLDLTVEGDEGDSDDSRSPREEESDDDDWLPSDERLANWVEQESQGNPVLRELLNDLGKIKLSRGRITALQYLGMRYIDVAGIRPTAAEIAALLGKSELYVNNLLGWIRGSKKTGVPDYLLGYQIHQRLRQAMRGLNVDEQWIKLSVPRPTGYKPGTLFPRLSDLPSANSTGVAT